MLCDALAGQYAAGKSSNLYLGFRCFATDVLTLFCYNKTLEATKAPDFHADIVIAAETMLPLLSILKYSSLLVTFLHSFPPSLGKKIGPPVMTAFYQLREVRSLSSQYAALGGVSFHTGPPVALIGLFRIIYTASTRAD